MSVGNSIFPTESLNSLEIINVRRIRYPSNRIFKFLKTNKSQWDKVYFQQNLQIFKHNKCQREKVSFQQNRQTLKKYKMSVGYSIFPTESLNP